MELEFLRLKFPLENTIQQPRNKQSVETNVENQKTPTQEEITECKPTLCMQQPKKKGSPETNAKTPTQEEITECKLTLCSNPETNAAQKPTQKLRKQMVNRNSSLKDSSSTWIFCPPQLCQHTKIEYLKLDLLQ